MQVGVESSFMTPCSSHYEWMLDVLQTDTIVFLFTMSCLVTPTTGISYRVNNVHGGVAHTESLIYFRDFASVWVTSSSNVSSIDLDFGLHPSANPRSEALLELVAVCLEIQSNKMVKDPRHDGNRTTYKRRRSFWRVTLFACGVGITLLSYSIWPIWRMTSPHTCSCTLPK